MAVTMATPIIMMLTVERKLHKNTMAENIETHWFNGETNLLYNIFSKVISVSSLIIIIINGKIKYY